MQGTARAGLVQRARLAIHAKRLTMLLVPAFGCAMALLSTVAPAQELPQGAECPLAATATVINDFDAGWFHNKPSLTRTQDGYSPVAGGNTSGWSELNWTEGQIGANQAVVSGHGVDEVTGSGLTLYYEGTERTRYLIAGASGSTLAQAATGNQYLQYAFTTPLSLAKGTFFNKVHILSYQASKFKYAVRASTDPSFATYWTLVQDVQVDLPGNNSNSWQHFPANNTRRPVLQPGTTYYLRLYLYDRQADAVIANDSTTTKDLPTEGTHVIVADDFMFGTAVCAPPQVTLTKVSNGKTGTFAFSGNNGYPSHTITTASIGGSGKADSAYPLTDVEVATTLSEATVAGFKLSNISCTGLGTGSATNLIPGTGTTAGSVTLDAAATTWGANIACTFTNQSTEVDLSITKSNPETQLLAGGTTTYTLTIGNKGPAAADGAVLKDTPDATHLANCTVLTPCTSTGNATCPATLSDILSTNGASIPALPAGGSLSVKVQCDVL